MLEDKKKCPRLLSSADGLCEEFGPRSGRTERRTAKSLVTLIVFLKELFEKFDFE